MICGENMDAERIFAFFCFLFGRKREMPQGGGISRADAGAASVDR